MGKFIIIAGVVIVTVGLLVTLFERHGFRGGPLPGNIYVKRGNLTLYLPIVTCVVLSIVLTLVLWAVSFFSKR